MSITKVAICLILLAGLFQEVVNDEPTDFSYDQHGANWLDSCINESRTF